MAFTTYSVEVVYNDGDTLTVKTGPYYGQYFVKSKAEDQASAFKGDPRVFSVSVVEHYNQ